MLFQEHFLQILQKYLTSQTMAKCRNSLDFTFSALERSDGQNVDNMLIYIVEKRRQYYNELPKTVQDQCRERFASTFFPILVCTAVGSFVASTLTTTLTLWFMERLSHSYTCTASAMFSSSTAK